MALSTYNWEKYPVHTENSPPLPGARISLPFTLRSLFFQITEVFVFLIGYNGEFKKESLKIINSKFQKPKQYFCEVYWGENSG